MASLVVSPSIVNVTDINQNTVTVNFTSDKTLTDVKLSTNNGSTYKDKMNMTQTSATFDITGMSNNSYSCKLKGYYEEADTSKPPSTTSGIKVEPTSVSIKVNETSDVTISFGNDVTNKTIEYMSSGGGTGGGSTSGNISNASETAITQQYSTSHEATPNNPNPPAGAYNWLTKPRINPDGSFPQSTWNAIGHWMTTYKVSGSTYYDNVGLLLQDPKAWIWNTATKSWDILSDDFEYGTWYREDFWDDGSGNIAGTTEWETGVSANHSKLVKIKQTSETSGRCFHPWGYQKNWRSNSNWANNGQPYIVTKVDFKLIKYDESGVDNLDKARLVVNSGADWWRNVGDTWQPDWSTNRDMAVGKYVLATRELKRAWCTNLPQSWSYGFPE